MPGANPSGANFGAPQQKTQPKASAAPSTQPRAASPSTGAATPGSPKKAAGGGPGGADHRSKLAGLLAGFKECLIMQVVLR